MRRIPAAELLDDDLGTAEEVRASLDDLWWLNRRFGGLNSYRGLLDEALAGRKSSPVRWLEVGAGTGQVTAALRDGLESAGYTIEAWLLDRRASHLAAQGAPATRRLRAVAGDILQAPFPEGSFDLVSCSLFLHHFSGTAAVAMLSAMARLSRGAVVINDLQRSWPAYWGVRLLGIHARSRLTRHDAPISVRQAYTLDELAELARAAGMKNFHARPAGLFRMGLVAQVRMG